MARITIDTETETPRGWSYHVRIEHADGRTSDHAVTLSWADHEHFTGGTTPPSRVVEWLVAFLTDREGQGDVPAPLPFAFDASTARRWCPLITTERL